MKQSPPPGCLAPPPPLGREPLALKASFFFTLIQMQLPQRWQVPKTGLQFIYGAVRLVVQRLGISRIDSRLGLLSVSQQLPAAPDPSDCSACEMGSERRRRWPLFAQRAPLIAADNGQRSQRPSTALPPSRGFFSPGGCRVEKIRIRRKKKKKTL